jgi:hypothetical protein
MEPTVCPLALPVAGVTVSHGPVLPIVAAVALKVTAEAMLVLIWTC